MKTIEDVTKRFVDKQAAGGRELLGLAILAVREACDTAEMELNRYPGLTPDLVSRVILALNYGHMGAAREIASAMLSVGRMHECQLNPTAA